MWYDANDIIECGKLFIPDMLHAQLYRKGQGKKQLTWRIFSLKELHAATNNFNYDNKLGEGAFGSVYWGQLWDGSQVMNKCSICIYFCLWCTCILFVNLTLYSY